MNYYFTYGLLIPLLASILLIIILYSQNKKRKKIVERLVFEKHELETLRKNELKDYFEEEWKRGENELDLRLSSKREAINSESTIATTGKSFGSTHTIFICASGLVIT